MNLDELTMGQVKQIQSLLSPKQNARHPFTVGEKYFIRTATYFHVGRLKDVCGKWLVLEKASWIADTGRFHDFLKEGKCNEYESFVEDVFIPLDSVIDITKWTHALYEGQK